MTGVISLAISIVIFAGVFVTSVKTQNTTGTPVITGANPVCTSGALVNCTLPDAWSATELALWGTMTLVGVAGLLYGTLSVFGLI